MIPINRRASTATARCGAANYPKIRVCFLEGSQALREVVTNVAKEWQAEDNSVRLDFGKPGKRRTCQPENGKEMQIRVSFSQDGYWSQLGQNAVVFVDQKEPSLNLGGFMNVSPDQLSDYEIGTIRHEFGHALGIEHEHQNPKGGCDNEYNWKLIYSYLEGPAEQLDQGDDRLEPAPGLGRGPAADQVR